MTAYPELDSATETMRRGSCDYICKPFKQDELVTAVDRPRSGWGSSTRMSRSSIVSFGQRIRSHRLSQNLTLRQLSDRTDLTTSQFVAGRAWQERGFHLGAGAHQQFAGLAGVRACLAASSEFERDAAALANATGERAAPAVRCPLPRS